MSSDVCVGFELVSSNAVPKWREVIGPTNSAAARQSAPSSIRAKFGGEGPRNAVHGSDSEPSYKRESGFWFGGDAPEKRPMKTTAVMDNCTLCIIKPHMLREGLAG